MSDYQKNHFAHIVRRLASEDGFGVMVYLLGQVDYVYSSVGLEVQDVLVEDVNYDGRLHHKVFNFVGEVNLCWSPIVGFYLKPGDEGFLESHNSFFLSLFQVFPFHQLGPVLHSAIRKWIDGGGLDGDEEELRIFVAQVFQSMDGSWGGVVNSLGLARTEFEMHAAQLLDMVRHGDTKNP